MDILQHTNMGKINIKKHVHADGVSSLQQTAYYFWGEHCKCHYLIHVLYRGLFSQGVNVHLFLPKREVA